MVPLAPPAPPSSPPSPHEPDGLVALRKTRERVTAELDRARHEQASFAAAAAEAQLLHRSALVDAVLAGTPEARAAAEEHAQRRIRAVEGETATLHAIEAAVTALGRVDRQIEEAVAALAREDERRLVAALDATAREDEDELVRRWTRLWLRAALKYGRAPGDPTQLLAGNQRLALRLSGASATARAQALRREFLEQDREVNREARDEEVRQPGSR